MSFQLAANAEMLFLDLEFSDRVHKLHDEGFQVEIWDWTTKDITALRSTGASFSSMTGYVSGDLITAEGRDALLSSALESLKVAERLDCPRLNLHGTGLDHRGLPVTPGAQVSDAQKNYAIETLREVAQLGEAAGRVFTLENLNRRVDHPGTPFATSEETSELVRAVDSPALRLNLDLYHAQVDEGDLIQRSLSLLPWVGEFQVADVPHRREPGTGEINYRGVARALEAAGYTGVIGLEAWAESDSALALRRFRNAFELTQSVTV